MEDKFAMGKRITQLLYMNDLTQSKLAKIIGVSRTSLSRYVTGDRKPRFDKIEKMAKALGTTTDYLISGDSSSILMVTSGSDGKTKRYKIKMVNGDQVECEMSADLIAGVLNAIAKKHYFIKLIGNDYKKYINVKNIVSIWESDTSDGI